MGKVCAYTFVLLIAVQTQLNADEYPRFQLVPDSSIAALTDAAQIDVDGNNVVYGIIDHADAFKVFAQQNDSLITSDALDIDWNKQSMVYVINAHNTTHLTVDDWGVCRCGCGHLSVTIHDSEPLWTSQHPAIFFPVDKETLQAVTVSVRTSTSADLANPWQQIGAINLSDEASNTHGCWIN